MTHTYNMHVRTLFAVGMATVLLTGCNARGPELSQIDGGPPTTTNETATAPAKPVSGSPSHLDGIPQRGATLGRPSASVTVTEYLDLGCPVCAKYQQGPGRKLIDTLVRDGRVKLELRHFNVFGDPSRRAAVWQLAAAQQNRGWQFAEQYLQSGPKEGDAFSEPTALALARDSGVDINRLQRDITDPALKRKVNAQYATGRRLRLPGTPSFVVSGPGGTATLAGYIPFEQMQNAVRTASAGSSKRS